MVSPGTDGAASSATNEALFLREGLVSVGLAWIARSCLAREASIIDDDTLGLLHQNQRLASVGVPSDQDFAVFGLAENGESDKVMSFGGLKDLVSIKAKPFPNYLKRKLYDVLAHDLRLSAVVALGLGDRDELLPMRKIAGDLLAGQRRVIRISNALVTDIPAKTLMLDSANCIADLIGHIGRVVFIADLLGARRIVTALVPSNDVAGDRLDAVFDLAVFDCHCLFLMLKATAAAAYPNHFGILKRETRRGEATGWLAREADEYTDNGYSQAGHRSARFSLRFAPPSRYGRRGGRSLTHLRAPERSCLPNPASFATQASLTFISRKERPGAPNLHERMSAFPISTAYAVLFGSGIGAVEFGPTALLT